MAAPVRLFANGRIRRRVMFHSLPENTPALRRPGQGFQWLNKVGF
jgi:hypothetical protein